MLLAQELGAHNLLVKRDSLLVKGRVSGEYQANNPQLALYLKYVIMLRKSFTDFKLIHVSREQNTRADFLAKLASLGKGGRHRSVIQETLKSPCTTREKKEEEVQAEVLEISPTHGKSHKSLTQETLRVP